MRELILGLFAMVLVTSTMLICSAILLITDLILKELKESEFVKWYKGARGWIEKKKTASITTHD